MVASNHPHFVEPDILKVLPEPLLGMKRWLLWRAEPHPKKPGKLRKIPVYTNGRQRKGLLDTESDLAQLSSLEDAMAELKSSTSYAGLGFALAGDGVSAFDLDGVLDGNGELIMSHPGAEVAIAAEVIGAYIEKSPSGTGLRIVGPCAMDFPAYSKDGLEWWQQRRYVTLTGDVFANPGGWVDLEPLRKTLGEAADQAAKDRADDSDEIITPETIETLRDALTEIDSDERETWIKIGMALKTLPGNRGYDLWMDWSKTSPKFDQGDADFRWESFRPVQTSYKVVFAEAQREGWVNPKKGTSKRDARDAFAEDDEDTPQASVKSLQENRIDFGDLDILYPTEFIIDGFLPVGVSVIAGAWGAGKSTNLIPLLASAAHLAPDDWGFRPTLRRKVIWITEAPEQARDTLFSLARAEGSAPAPEFKEWFILFRAVRLAPKKLARMLKALIDDCTYSLENGFVVHPVIVLDTTAANIEIENESDNSMVSQAMAILKQALPGISIILVGHTPKALVKADVNDMTFRGAGAWEADAVATYFLVYDQDTDTRYLAIRKCRFNPTYREVDFDHEGGSKIIDTPWGEPQSKAYLHGVPTKSDGSQRRQAQSEVMEQRRDAIRERSLSDRQQRILSFVTNETEGGRPVTRAAIKREIGGKAELVTEATTRLLEREILVAHLWDVDILGPTRSSDDKPLILPAEVDLELFLQRVAARSSE